VADIDEHFESARGAELFRALHEIAVALAGVLEPRMLASVVADKARSLLRAEAVGLFAWNEAAGVLQALYADDPPATTPLLPSEGIVGRAFQLGRAVLVDDYPRSARAISWAVESGTRSAAAVPLIVNGRSIGVLAARNNRVDADLAEQAQILALLAAFVAPALEAARLHEVGGDSGATAECGAGHGRARIRGAIQRSCPASGVPFARPGATIVRAGRAHTMA
jgi:GAF domain-containing protein